MDQAAAIDVAQACTAAWNLGSPEAVASFFADGKVVASRGWYDAEDYSRQVGM